MLTVAVLGPVEVRRDGALMTLPSGKPTEVLVRLALDAGAVVRSERIIEDVWAAHAAAAGLNTLQSKVSQLRRAVGDPGVIVNSHRGYMLAIEADSVDALRVAELAASAAALRRAGDAAGTVEIATEALALFRGEVLADAGDSGWLDPHRLRLEELRVSLLEHQLAGRSELGAAGDLVGQLEELVERFPLREGLWALLITALYRHGRQADALAAYGRVRATLVDELGLEPGLELQDLQRQILKHSRVLDAARSHQRVSRPLSVGNLPRLSATLVGRGLEIGEVRQRLDRGRLVTVIGPAGVGKTRLAIEAAQGLQPLGGGWLVRLDAVDAASSVGQTIAESMGLASEQQLVERIAGVETLLLIDNCEHVADAVADVVSVLLDRSALVKVFATCQFPLRLDGESVFELDPLAIDESVQLFATRALEIRPQFLLDDAATRAVREICLSLDGLPLAIELAAARVKSLSLVDIATRLDDRFALLQDPSSRRPERRRALGAAIGWSYDLLLPDDQRGLWVLASYAGGAPLTAVEHSLAALDVSRRSAIDVIGRLVDRSMLIAEPSADGAMRYRLLDSIRLFGLDRLRDAGLEQNLLSAQASWVAEQAHRLAATVRGAGQGEALAFVRAERANVDAALAWCAQHDPLLGLSIAVGCGWTWVVLGDGVAGADRVRSALLAAGSLATPRLRAEALLLAGWLESSAGNLGRAEVDLTHAVTIADELADDILRADAQRHRAFFYLMQGRPADARAAAERSLRPYRERELAWEEAASLLLSASASMMLGSTSDATSAAREAVRILTPIGDSWGLVHAEAMLGAIAQAERRFEDAARYLNHAAEMAQQLGFPGQVAYHLTMLGRVEHQAGHTDAANATLKRALETATATGDGRMATWATLNLARVLRTTGQHDSALVLLRQAHAWYSASGDGDGALLTRALLASTATLVDASPVEISHAQLEKALVEARHDGDHEVELLTLDALARLRAESGAVDVARTLLGSADGMLAAAVRLVDEVDRIDAHLARALLD